MSFARNAIVVTLKGWSNKRLWSSTWGPWWDESWYNCWRSWWQYLEKVVLSRQILFWRFTVHIDKSTSTSLSGPCSNDEFPVMWLVSGWAVYRFWSYPSVAWTGRRYPGSTAWSLCLVFVFCRLFGLTPKHTGIISGENTRCTSKAISSTPSTSKALSSTPSCAFSEEGLVCLL